MCRRFLFLGASLLFGDSTCGETDKQQNYCGKSGIQTHGTDKPFTGFRVRPIRSLWHLSLKYHKGTWIFGPLFRKRYFFFLPASECFHPETVRVSFKEKLPDGQLGRYQLCNWCMTSCTTGTARVAQLVYAVLGRCSHGLSDRLHVPLYERYQKTK